MAMLNKLSLCDEKIKKKYYDPYFKGNATWVFPDCIITTVRICFIKVSSTKVNEIAFFLNFRVIWRLARTIKLI